MRKPNLPYLEFKTIKGREYIYFRKGRTRIRLHANPDSEEFMKRYWEIRSGRKKAPVKANWDALITRYLASPKFKAKAAGTRANYRRHCDTIREKNGAKDVRLFRRKHALAARDALAETWSKANERVAVLSVLCKFAVDLEWIERNPVVDIEKLEGGEYQPWPDAKLTAFENYCDRHEAETARTIYELCIGTGQRIGDCAAMEWSDFDGEYMSVVQDKTKTKMEVFCPSRLRIYLNALPRRGRHILAKNLAQHVGKRQAQKAVEEVRRAIGVMDGPDRLVPHGWRYTAAVELAEAGCSDSDIQAVTGHRSIEMVRKYRAQANQKDASKRAQTRREQNRHRM